MANSRTLKLSILADVDDLNKKLKSANGDVETSSNKLGEFGKKAGLAFAAAAAAAAAYAGKLAIDGVKAAIEDEKAQTQLALALENATGATKAQVKATEDSILQMSLATGVADDDLRPALGRLVRSTGDTQKAQELLAQALDISAATGKPLETVAAALSKGFDGNTAALGKLGIGLSTAELKTMSFEQVQNRLSDLFGGAAAANADTYAGKIARVQVAFNEAKESVGAALLPILDKLLSFINKNALPAIQAFTSAFSLTSGDGFGKTINDVGNTIKQVVQPIFEGMKTVFDKVKSAIMDSKDELADFWQVVKYIAPLIGKVIGDSLKVIGEIAGVVITLIGKVLGAIRPVLNTAIDGINMIIKGVNLIKTGDDISLIPKIGSTGASTSTGALGNFSMSTGTTTSGTTTSGTTTSGEIVGTPTGSGGVAGAVAAAVNIGSFNAGKFRAAEAATSGNNYYNISVTGAIDSASTARQIAGLLKTEANTSGSFNTLGLSTFG